MRHPGRYPAFRFGLFLFFSTLFSVFTITAQEIVYVVDVDGVINPASSEYMLAMIEKAEKENAHCLVFQLDTPGGLVTSMREITQGILSAKVPIAVYIHPAGAHAASAGTFITMSAHVAAMTPGSNIGAASVVSMGVGKDSMETVVMRKATNDAIAFIKSVAEKRGRNAEWAEKAVTEAASVTANEALSLNIIDYVSPTLDSLLIQMDGHKADLDTAEVILATRSANRQYLEMPLRYRILDVISDPNIAYLLLIIGFYGIMFEMYNTGAIFPGIAGAICIILAFYAMNTLPVNYTGILLILVAIVMFVLEIKIVSHGALTIGGIVALALGSIMLYDSDLPYLRVSWPLVATVVITTTLFFSFVIGIGLRAQRLKPAIGQETLQDSEGFALGHFENGQGQIQYEGEIWQARSDQEIKENDPVKILQIDGLELIVVKKEMT